MSGTIKFFALLSLLAGMVLIAACGTPPEQTAQRRQPAEAHPKAAELAAVNLTGNQKLNVVATTNIIGDWVQNVGGNMVNLTVLLPVGSDPHAFSPTPQDTASGAHADVVFINGLHLEEFLEELITNAGGQAPVVTVSREVETRTLADRGEADHEGVDPHVWMSPANAGAMVGTIEQALSQLDPANATAYRANAAAYQAQLADLDAWVKDQIDNIPANNRKLVTDHDSFGYFANRYGLEIVGAVVPAFSTNAEPSARELAELQQVIQTSNTKAIFVGTTINPVLADQIAADTGIKVIPLYTGSLGQPGSGTETYLDFIRYNTTALVKGLK